jgi:hypothetical protein
MRVLKASIDRFCSNGCLKLYCHSLRFSEAVDQVPGVDSVSWIVKFKVYHLRLALSQKLFLSSDPSFL